MLSKPFIIVVGGLPASGKTTYAKNLVLGLDNYVLVDDLSLTKESCLKYLKQKVNLVVIDPHFVLKKFREKFEQEFSSVAEISYVMFENDKIQCLMNEELRPDKPVRGLINYLSSNYTLPKTYKLLPVWRPDVN